MRGLGFWTSLSIVPQQEHFSIGIWNERFADLTVEEIYVGPFADDEGWDN